MSDQGAHGGAVLVEQTRDDGAGGRYDGAGERTDGAGDRDDGAGERYDGAGERGGGAAGWCCPVCDVPVPHPHRPGRARVYCTNSCRQRAYRWRRQRRGQLPTPTPPERGDTFDRSHALRSSADFVGHRSARHRSGRPRRVTACGTFAHAAHEQRRRMSHTKFYVTPERGDPTTPSASTCRRCTELLGVPIESMEIVLDRILDQRK